MSGALLAGEQRGARTRQKLTTRRPALRQRLSPLTPSLLRTVWLYIYISSRAYLAVLSFVSPYLFLPLSLRLCVRACVSVCVWWVRVFVHQQGLSCGLGSFFSASALYSLVLPFRRSRALFRRSCFFLPLGAGIWGGGRVGGSGGGGGRSHGRRRGEQRLGWHDMKLHW